MIALLLTILYTFLYTLGTLWIFWYFYVLIMGLYRAHLSKSLTKSALILAYPAVIVGYLIDIGVNWTIATVIFFEPPISLTDTVSNRLTRYIRGEDGRRKKQALFICHNLLDYFDPSGKHCG